MIPNISRKKAYLKKNKNDLPSRKLSDVLKRKKAPKRSLGRKSKEEGTSSETKPSSRSSGRAKSASGKEGKTSSSSKISFLPSLNPRSWAKFSSSDRVPKTSASKVCYDKVRI